MRRDGRPVVVTGAGGFIGANLCRHFLSRGVPVVAADHRASGNWRLEPLKGLRRVHADLSSRRDVRRLVRAARPSVVVNCAAFGAYSKQSDPDKIYAVNFDGVRYLLEELRGLEGLRAFIQAGSSSEYGLNCTAPSERSATEPDSHYAVSKTAATGLVQYFGKRLGMPAWSFRIYSVYGPMEEISRLIPTLLLAAKKGALPPLVSPTISRDYMHVDDLASAVDCLIRRAPRLTKGEVYNIGTGRMTDMRALVAAARRLFRVKEKPRWGSMADRAWDNPRWFADPRKARRDLGWRPRVSLERGLVSTLRWMDANPALMAAASANSILKK
ncbi:MAG TPA: NAD-dependent epimerase/dehydratase family protein [Candidatus Eisenbacteria bacterium]|nr:NAD-dependent epimerase/dehydratase family protein [Candidatus Eisenbacteria bacterium]